MYNNQITLAPLALLATIACGPLAGQEVRGEIMANIAPCSTIASREARLTCFDALGADVMDAAPASDTAAPASPPAVATVTAPVPVPVVRAAEPASAAPGPEDVENFGVQTPEGARVQANAGGDMVLYDQITKLEERVPGRWLITLASGQLWYQSNSQRLRLREGMEVRIYPSPLGGSFRMARNDGESNGFVQVSRVQ